MIVTEKVVLLTVFYMQFLESQSGTVLEKF